MLESCPEFRLGPRPHPERAGRPLLASCNRFTRDKQPLNLIEPALASEGKKRVACPNGLLEKRPLANRLNRSQPIPNIENEYASSP
jgi:hypothetical protein